MSQNTKTSVKDSGANTITIRPVVPPGFELVSSETLKLLFAVKEQKEAEAASAARHIDALVADREVWKTLSAKQDSVISLYKDNQYDYQLLQQSFKENIQHNNKVISGLEFKVKVWKGVAIAIPILGGAAYTYFKFIK